MNGYVNVARTHNGRLFIFKKRKEILTMGKDIMSSAISQPPNEKS